jgi:glutamate/tyrosine decarboxylase-like PLP-dependent enzyme
MKWIRKMNNIDSLQSRLFEELHDDGLFERARRYGTDYLSAIFQRNVYPEDAALNDLDVFDEDLPTDFTPARDILEQLNRYGAPATVAQVGGRYFGFVNGGVVPAGLAARVLADFWDQNTAMQVISPIAAKLESVVEVWLRQLLGLPDETAAGFVSGTFLATFAGLAAARFRILERKGWNVNERGLRGALRIRIVAGSEAHSTVHKALGLLGLGTENVEWVAADDQGRMIPDELPELDDSTILILQAGNVNTGAFDPFETLCTRARAAGAWVHIDGAFGLWAGATPQFQHLTRGMELATSWSVDGHKTLNTPYDCGIVLCADPGALTAALHSSGAYFVTGAGRDGMFYTPEMSRRARIVELWATMRSLGTEGIDALIGGLHERARQFADELRAAGFEVLNDIHFNQVLVRCGDDESTRALLERVQTARVCWCGGSQWDGKAVIRVSVCSWATTAEDVTRSVLSFAQARQAIDDAAAR